jgi:hypothetical protein
MAETRGLEQLDVLVGEWAMTSKKYSEGDGRQKVERIEGGAFLRLQTSQAENRFPASMQIIGADESSGECTCLYWDSRGISRVYRMTVAGGEWRVWREAPGFNQRYIGSISADGKTISGNWEFSEDGSTWGVDFDLTFTRVGRA